MINRKAFELPFWVLVNGSPTDGACTVLGDRPEESTDSRAFGPVPLGNLLGRALFRYAPIGRIGWLW